MANGFLPLDGVRVVDVTSSLAGPYCTEILGALGADVVKVEHPDRGDEARAWGPPFWEGSSVMFYAANLNKRSLALDLKRGREVLLRLVDSADVFLQSLRPGTATRLGFGAEELRARNPRLVYCDIGAFGRAGPLRERPGYDPLLQGFSRIGPACASARPSSTRGPACGQRSASSPRCTRAEGTRWTCRSSRRRWGSCPTRSPRISPAAARPVATGRPSR